MLRALILLYPVIEVVVFILVGAWIGFGWAFPILLLSPLVGFFLARGALRRMRQRIPSQRSTSKSTDTFTADIAVTLLTGALLVIPGIATFVLGLLLLLPPVRSLVASRLGRSLGLRVMSLGERFTVVRPGSRGRDGGTGRSGRTASSGTGSGWGEVIDHRSQEFDDGAADTHGTNGTDGTGGTGGANGTDGAAGTDGAPGSAR